MIFDKNGMMGRRVQHHNASEMNEQKLDHWDKGTKKKITTSATNELESILAKQDLTELLGKTHNKMNKLVVGLWKTSQNYEVTTGH